MCLVRRKSTARGIERLDNMCQSCLVAELTNDQLLIAVTHNCPQFVHLSNYNEHTVTKLLNQKLCWSLSYFETEVLGVVCRMTRIVLR